MEALRSVMAVNMEDIQEVEKISTRGYFILDSLSNLTEAFRKKEAIYLACMRFV